VTPVAEGAGVALSYEEHGEGRAVLLVHGMAAGARHWTEAVQELAPRARVIAYDRRGYGGSGAPDPYERTTVQEQAEDAAALLRGLGAGPAVLCGADFGALVCLDLIKRHAGLVAGAVLVDPLVLAFVPEAAEALAAERVVLEEALREHGPQQAVTAYLATGARPADEERARAARAAHGAFFADYGGGATWPVRRRELREIAVPVTVADGERALPHVRAAGDALVELIPGARREGAEDPAGLVSELLQTS